MNEKRKEGRKAGGILLQLVLLALVPLLIAIFTVAFIAIVSMVNGMQSESLVALADLGGSVKAAYEMVDGEYHVEGDALYKGDMNLTEAEDLIDSFVEGSESDVTLFYGDTRYETGYAVAEALKVSAQIFQWTQLPKSIYNILTGNAGKVYSRIVNIFRYEKTKKLLTFFEK